MSSSEGFLRSAVVYGVGGAAAQIAAALLLPLYTHYLTPADYGVLELIERTGAIVVLLLLGNGIRMATFAFYCQAKTSADRQQTFSTIAIVLWIILTVGSVAGIVLAPWLAEWLQIEDWRLVAFGIVVVMVQSFLTFPMALMQARVEAFTFIIVNLIVAVARTILIVASVVWLGMGVWGVLLASAVTFTVAGILLTRREISLGFPLPNFNLARQVIYFALPLLPSGIMALSLAGADRYFLVTYRDAAEVGTYAFAAKIASMLPGAALNPLWKVWTAKLYEYYSAPDARTRVGRVVLRILASQIFLALGVSIFGHELVTLLAPASYAAAAIIIPVAALAGILQVANNLFEGAFWSQRQTKYKPILMACSASVALIGFFILVPKWGGIGAAAALAFAYFVHTSLTFMVTQRIFPVYYDWRSVTVATTLAGALYLTSHFVIDGVLGWSLKLVLWIAWPVLLWLLGIVTREEQQWCVRQVTRGRQLADKWLFAAAP